VVAADSSKLGQRAFARICAAELVDTLVTDTAVAEETVRRFEEAGIQVLAV
jgi:DeoR family transcriptional regulator of aga operon